jgi:acyl-CoA oxidase
VKGGYQLNGNKRWIGNGNRDILIIWGQQEGKVNGFIIDTKSKGLSTKVIQGKIPLRIVQNCDILLEDVFVPEENRLPGVDTFSDITKVNCISNLVRS